MVFWSFQGLARYILYKKSLFLVKQRKSCQRNLPYEKVLLHLKTWREKPVFYKTKFIALLKSKLPEYLALLLLLSFIILFSFYFVLNLPSWISFLHIQSSNSMIYVIQIFHQLHASWYFSIKQTLKYLHDVKVVLITLTLHSCYFQFCCGKSIP